MLGSTIGHNRGVGGGGAEGGRNVERMTGREGVGMERGEKHCWECDVGRRRVDKEAVGGRKVERMIWREELGMERG